MQRAADEIVRLFVRPDKSAALRITRVPAGPEGRWGQGISSPRCGFEERRKVDRFTVIFRSVGMFHEVATVP